MEAIGGQTGCHVMNLLDLSFTQSGKKVDVTLATIARINSAKQRNDLSSITVIVGVACMDGIRIGDAIAKGDIYDVMAGTSTTNGKEVHIIIVDDAQMGKIDHARLERLSPVINDLNHLNLLKYHKVLRSENQTAVVMEHPKGITIKDLLLSKPMRRLTEAECKVWILQLVNVLEYLHSRGIAHRNINMLNVFVDTEKKLLQLGDLLIVPKMFPIHANASSHSLNYHFCALENWLAEDSQIGAAADVWSLGILLYLMTCGCYPFQGNHELEILSSIGNGLYSIPNFLSDECTSFLKSILVTDPSKRSTLPLLKSHPWLSSHPSMFFPSGHNIMPAGMVMGMPPIPEMMEDEDIAPKPSRRTSGNVYANFAPSYPRFAPEPTTKTKKTPLTPKRRRQSDSILTSAEVKDILGIGTYNPRNSVKQEPQISKTNASLLQSLVPPDPAPNQGRKLERRHSIDSSETQYLRGQAPLFSNIFTAQPLKQDAPLELDTQQLKNLEEDLELSAWINQSDFDKDTDWGVPLPAVFEGGMGGNADVHSYHSSIDDADVVGSWLSDPQYLDI